MRSLRLLLPLLLLTLCVFAAPAQARPDMVVGIEQFGNMESPATGPALMDAQREVGAKVIRYIVRWDWVAKCDPTTKGAATNHANACYDWSSVDYVNAQANARGMKVLLSIWGTPGWVHNSTHTSFTGTTDAQYARFVAHFSDFTQAAATRYDGKHGHARVDQWTIWNEPNGNFFEPRWDANNNLIGPARYARLYDTAARRVKVADPTLRVAVGPTAPLDRKLPPITFMQGVLPLLNSWNSPIDAWAHNAYIAGQSPFATTIKSPKVGLGNIRDLTALLDTYPVTRNAPVWITEFGYRTGSTGSDSIDVNLQAVRAADALRFAYLNDRISTFIWYSLQDEPVATGFNSGLFYGTNITCATKLCPKPVALVFQRTLWISTRTKQGYVTAWGQSRVKPAQTRIFVQQPGKGWSAYANTATATNGTVEMTLALPVGTKLMTCDTHCSAPRTVEQGTASGGGTGGAVTIKKTSKVVKLPATTLARVATLNRGFSYSMTCKGCKVTTRITAQGSASGIAAAKRRTVVVGRASVKRERSLTTSNVAFTRAARRELLTRSQARLVLRTFVTRANGTKVIYQRVLVLR